MTTSSAKDKKPESGAGQKSPSKAELVAELDALKARLEEETGSGVVLRRDKDNKVVKIGLFDDPIEDAFAEALQEEILHPLGNVDDESYWPEWAAGIARKVSRKLGVQPAYVRASFHRDDRLGIPFDDENTIRVQLQVGSEYRNTILVDPTPED